MKKIRLFLLCIISAVAVVCIAAAFTGCGGGITESAPSDFTINAKGEFSFVGIDGADTYVIAVYNKADVKDGKIPEVKYVARQSFVNGDGAQKITGTAKSLQGQLGYKDYTVFIWGERHDGEETTTSQLATYNLSPRGKLSDPEISTSCSKYTGKITVSDTSIAAYLSTETIISFSIEIYNDEAMTDLADSGTFGTNVQVSTATGPGASGYTDTSYEITYDPAPEELNDKDELITPKKYYVRVKANGNGTDITESGWTDDVVEITGKSGNGGGSGS